MYLPISSLSVERELVGREGEDRAQRLQACRPAYPQRMFPQVDDEQHDTRYDRVDQQCVDTGARKGRNHCDGSDRSLDTEVAHCDESEPFLFVKQCVGDDVHRCEKQVDRQKLADAYQLGRVVIGGDQPRTAEKEQRYGQSRPNRERKDAVELLAGQFLVLNDRRGDAQVAEDAEKGDDNGSHRDDTEIRRRQQARQHTGDRQRDDDARVFGDRDVKDARRELFADGMLVRALRLGRLIVRFGRHRGRLLCCCHSQCAPREAFVCLLLRISLRRRSRVR